MAIFFRSLNRRNRGIAALPTIQPRSRILTFEPLEDRRLLAHAPLNFTVSNTGGPGVNLSWTDNGATGYEIQSSVNGLNDEANPIAWKTGLWRTTKTEPAGSQDSNFDRFRSYYFRIQALPATNPPHWSTIEYTTAPPEDNVVKVSAAVLPGVEMITLRWPEELKFASSTYTISRKAKDDLTWTELVSGDTGNDWVDFDVEQGKAYEYEVKRSSPSGTGYVYAGLELALDDADSTIESPGTVMLVIDITLTGMVPDEMDRLEDDLRAEGWDVLKIYVSPHDDLNPQSAENLNNIESKRNEIIEAYEDPNIDLTAVLLIGPIPIPMSGHNNPDGHGYRPFAADVYYGDMDGVWSDTNDGPINDPNHDHTVDHCLGGCDVFVSNPAFDGVFDQKEVPPAADGYRRVEFSSDLDNDGAEVRANCLTLAHDAGRMTGDLNVADRRFPCGRGSSWRSAL